MSNLTRDLVAAHTNGLKSHIHALEVQVTILKRLIGSDSASEETEETEELETKAAPKKKAAPLEEEDEAEDFGKKKAPAKKAASSFEETEEDEEPDFAAPAKSAKAKKITADEVNDACKAHAKENGVKATRALLVKKFGTQSITEIDAAKYPEVLKALKV